MPYSSALLANVVYKFKCLRDANNIYIGKTIQHLATRVKELVVVVFAHVQKHKFSSSSIMIYLIGNN